MFKILQEKKTDILILINIVTNLKNVLQQEVVSTVYFLNQNHKTMKTDREKFDKLFLKLHRYHNFRESHIKECAICNNYYSLYNALEKKNFNSEHKS